eukprot:992046-Rhodomonas_salina.1
MPREGIGLRTPCESRSEARGRAGPGGASGARAGPEKRASLTQSRRPQARRRQAEARTPGGPGRT